MNIAITGGCGFIASNFIRLVLDTCEGYSITNIDKLTYAGNLENIADYAKKYSDRYTFKKIDIVDKTAIEELFANNKFDAVVHFAAESHVDRSIADSTPFITTNIMGTQILLDAARKYNIPKFVHVSTDEVYGSLGDTGLFTEETPLAPNSPYSASKASSDLLVRAANETFGQYTVITRCSNNYGPFQFPEKLIPLMIQKAKNNEPLPIYGKGNNVRDWIHVEDHCKGVLLALQKGKSGGIYNFGGNAEKQNLEVVKAILNLLGKSEELITYVKDRPGHDLRYAMDYSLATKELGFNPEYTFEQGIELTVKWYLENTKWVENVISGEYKDFEKLWYGERI